MLAVVSTVLISCFIGTLGAWRPDIDINRFRLLPKETHRSVTTNQHTRRSIFRYNDYDDYRSGVSGQRSSVLALPHTLPTAASALEIHQPREDPRLYYLSDAYAKKFHQKHLSNEVSAIYNEGDVVRANSELYKRRGTQFARLRDRESNYIPQELTSRGICTKCPHDITLVAKPAVDRVKLPHPRLRSCSGLKLRRRVRYEHMHGPKFGALLTQGSHSIIGRITYKGKILRHCVMGVRVLTQTCPLPKYLVARCANQNQTCSFSCQDPRLELHGSSSLSCGNGNRWIGVLPTCKARSWCEMLAVPAHGTVSCKGLPIKGGLSEGSTCHVRCARGWKHSRPHASCRAGAWTNDLHCEPRNK